MGCVFSTSQDWVGEGWAGAADGHPVPTASQLGPKLTSGGLTPQKVLKMGAFEASGARAWEAQKTGGQLRLQLGWALWGLGGAELGRKCPPFHPLACPVCFLSLPQAWEVRMDGVGNFAQTSTPRPSRATTPSTAPGWVVEWKVPPTVARRCQGPCQGGWQCLVGMRRPEWVAGHSPPPLEQWTVPALQASLYQQPGSCQGGSWLPDTVFPGWQGQAAWGQGRNQRLLPDKGPPGGKQAAAPHPSPGLRGRKELSVPLWEVHFSDQAGVPLSLLRAVVISALWGQLEGSLWLGHLCVRPTPGFRVLRRGRREV